jgi:hypothetical protein
MEVRNLTEREWVQRCMTELCQKAGFADCGNLVQRELEFICDSIETKTGVLISLSTMKRLFKGQFSRQPQVATLDAISIFLGYEHWQDFKLKKSVETRLKVSNGSHKTEQVSRQIVTTHRFSNSRYVIIAGCLVIMAVGLFAFLKLGKSKTAHLLANGFEKAQFSMNRTTISDLPNTVVFNYNIEAAAGDSFFIQQSWDKDRRVRIDKKNHTLTDIYYEPGYHVAKLIAGEQVIKTIDVSIPTDNWFYYARERKPASIPEYIKCKGFKNGTLAMSKEEVLSSDVDIQKDHLYLQVWFPTHIEYNSDNYILKCRIKVNQVKNNLCPFLMCEVFCQHNFMYFKSCPKGCTHDMKTQFGETILDGKTTDLSSLGTNPIEWQDVEIVVRDKHVDIRINNETVLSTQYSQSSGKITGLGFLSNGLPEVDFVSLQTLDGKDIYSNGFDQ